MGATFSIQRRRAFTLIELWAIIGVVVLAAVLVLLPLARANAKAPRINCVNNLKQVGLAFRMWSDDANNGYPMTRSTNYGGTLEYIAGRNVYRHFLCMSNELANPEILACPADTRKPARSFATLSDSNISYFVGVDADESMPQMILTGDRNLATNGVPVTPGLVLIKTNDVVSWTAEMHVGCGNVGVADGSVQQATSIGFQQLNRGTGTNLNRFQVP